jgi:phosphohistidine phosphatase
MTHPIYPRPMLVYLVRHAEAAPGEPDELRALTEEGIRQARALGERLANEEKPPAAVRTSPLLRARQTGEAIAQAAGITAEPDERLAPGATADDVRVAVADCDEPAVVVGHQPDCGEIAAAVSGGPEPPFPAAGVVAIEI